MLVEPKEIAVNYFKIFTLFFEISTLLTQHCLAAMNLDYNSTDSHIFSSPQHSSLTNLSQYIIEESLKACIEQDK
jgi:hypothetical protein